MTRSPRRVASLLPSATEIVYALGLGDELVAVTHECDYPPDATRHARVTRSLLDNNILSAEIDRAVRDGIRDKHTIYELDAAQLIELAPDVVLTQSLCDVCAVARDAVEDAVCTMPAEARVVSLDPHTIDEVLESILIAGDALGVAERAAEVVDGLRARMVTVRAAVADAPRPRVLAVEWLEPIFRGGHWVSEQVAIAGGQDGLGRAGEPSSVVSWAEVLAYAPEVIVLMPCGFDGAEAARRVGELSRRTGWSELPAVRDEHVYAVNGSAYFSRPGPRLIDGIEVLAAVLHPDGAIMPAGASEVLRLANTGFETFTQ